MEDKEMKKYETTKYVIDETEFMKKLGLEGFIQTINRDKEGSVLVIKIVMAERFKGIAK